MSGDIAARANQAETRGASPPDWRRWAFDPLLTYVAVAAIAGTVLCCMLPLFVGNDEATHFVRAYQMSTGHLIAIDAPAHTRAGTGACVPSWLAVDYQVKLLEDVTRAAQVAPGPPTVQPRRTATEAERREFGRRLMADLRHCDGADHFFIDTSTFAWYSPVAYVPAAVAIAGGRIFGWHSLGLERSARLVQLAVVIALVALSIRRAPWGKWIFAIVGATPLALVVSATIRPDAITTGLSLLVIASALRVAHQGGFTRRTLVDALVWSTLLGLSKPTYWLVAGAFLVTLLVLHWRERGAVAVLRDGGWMAVGPLAIAAVASAAWQGVQRNRFICDVRFFGVHVDTQESVHRMLTQPHRFVGGVWGVLRDNVGKWLRDVVQVDTQITGEQWPVLVITLLLVGIVVLALRPTPGTGGGAPHVPGRGERSLYAVLGLALFVALAAGFAVYCSKPGTINALFFTARFLLPVMVFALLAATPGRRLAGLLARQPVPPVLALGGFYAGYLVVVSHTIP